MAQQRRRVKHTATFEERLAEEAIKLKKLLKSNLPAAQLESCFYGAPDRRKRRHTSTNGFALPDYSRPTLWKIWSKIRKSETASVGGPRQHVLKSFRALDGRIQGLCDRVSRPHYQAD